MTKRTTAKEAALNAPRHIAVDLDGIGHLLADNMFSVPLYQRSYSWGRSQVEELLQDLTQAFNASDRQREYFLGSIVIAYRESDRPEVVDGQQRLATISIILAAIRDFLVEQADDDTAAVIEQAYLLTRHMRSLDIIPRLLLNERDQAFFMEHVLKRRRSRDRSDDVERESHGRLAVAADAAAEHVRAVARFYPKPRNYLLDWVTYLERQVKVIRVQVPGHADAFTIFETLNHRGVDLSETDLVKNHIFHIAEDKLAEVREKWDSAFDALGAADESSRGVEFLRHFWSSLAGLTRKRELYNQIKRKVSSKRASLNFAEEASTAAPFYAAITDVDNALWSSLGRPSRLAVAVLNLLGMVRMRPLILSVLQCMKRSEREKTLQQMVSWGARLVIAGGLGTGTLEEGYASWASAIRSGKIKTSSDLYDAAREQIPSDAAFRSSFATETLPRSRVARYYLLALEKSINVGTNLVTDAELDEVVLKLVMPISPAGDWARMSPDLIAHYARRIGNAVLVDADVEFPESAPRFALRRETLNVSPYLFSERVAKHRSWNVPEIEERQQAMADAAVRAWPLPNA